MQDLAPLNGQKLPVLDSSHQTTNKTGTQTHPLTHRLPKVILSSKTPQNTPPDTALLIRGKRLSTTHQNTGTSPSVIQEAYTSHCTNLTIGGREQKPEELQSSSLGKRDLKYCKLYKRRRQRNTMHAKEQDKNPQDQINEEEIGKLPEKEFRVMIVKMIQNFKNRINTRNVQQGPRRTKEQTNSKE